MFTLQIARTLLQDAAKLALYAVPLAVLSVPAHAITAYLPVSDVEFTLNPNTTFCSGALSVEPLSNQDGTGIKVFTDQNGCSGPNGEAVLILDGSATGTASAYFQFLLHIEALPYGNGTGDLSVSYEGTVTHANGSIPLGSNPVNITPGNSYVINDSFGVPFDLSPQSWNLKIFVSQLNATNVGVVIPENSIDLITANASEVPEPASFLLLTPAAAWLMLRRRKMVA